MRIIYNGIDLYCQETYEYDMEAVFDDTGTDYLYTRHTIVARVIVNGQADVFYGRQAANGEFYRNGPAITYTFASGTSGPVGGPVPGYVPPGPPNESGTSAPLVGPAPDGYGTRPNPVQAINPSGNPFGNTNRGQGLSAGVTNLLRAVVTTPIDPTTTIQTIRHRLTTPRGRLFIFSGGWDGQQPAPVMLQSPGDGLRCDCKNGPMPRILRVHQVFGDAQTFLFDFAIETYINESVENLVYKSGPLLSNRFFQTHSLDDNSYTVITTEGIALFRTDFVYGQPYSPDQQRPLLFLPIPQGFVRSVPEVTGLPDVTGVRYAFRDTQVPVNFVAGPYIKAAKISAVHRQAVVNNADILQGAMTTYERVLGIQANRSIARDRPTIRAGSNNRGIPRKVRAATPPGQVPEGAAKMT